MADRHTRVRSKQLKDSDVRPEDLQGGIASPGNSKYYGTNDSGTTGFYDLPASTAFLGSFVDGDLSSGILTITHNLGTQYVSVVIVDDNDKLVMPDDVIMTSTTVVTVDLSSYGTLTGTWRYLVLKSGASLTAPTKIQDADGDTSVDCEQNTDEDKIRFKIAGSEVLRFEDGAVAGNIFRNTGVQNLLLNGSFEYWYAGTSSAPDGWAISGGTIARESTNIHRGSYSAKFTSTSGVQNLRQIVPNLIYSQLTGKVFTFSAYVKTSNSGIHIQIMENNGSQTNSSNHSGSGNWELLTVTHTVQGDGDALMVIVETATTSDVLYIDEAMLVEGSIPFAYQPHVEDHLYEQDNMSFGYTSCQTGDSCADHNSIINTVTGYSYSQNINGQLSVPLTGFLNKINGHPVVIDSFVVYYGIDGTGVIDQMQVWKNGASFIVYNADISVSGSVDILSAPVEMTEGSYIDFGMIAKSETANTDVKFYYLVIKYHVKVHG